MISGEVSGLGPALPPFPAERYQLLGELGRGGMGRVLRARDRESGERLAIKVLDCVAPRALERFRREIRALLRLKHPGVVQIRDAGWWGERPFLVMNWVEGRNLHQVIAEDNRGARPSLDWIIAILDQMAEALAYVHERGLIHRDIKPANIVIENESGRPVLVDFGLAKREAGAETSQAVSLTGSRDVVGTPGYMSPEQADPKSAFGEVGPKTDIWGLGATLYFCLSGGRGPFDAPSLAQVFAGILTGAPEPLKTFDAKVPSQIEKLCLSCLNKRPEDRPAPGELRERLAHHGLRSSRRNRKLGAPATGRPLARRALLLLGLIVPVLAAVLILVAPDRGSRSERSPDLARAREEAPSGTARWAGLRRLEAWRGLSRGAKEALARRLDREVLGAPYEFVELVEAECCEERLELARFRHLKTGIELHIVPGGRFVMGRDLSPEEREIFEANAEVDIPALAEDVKSLQRQIVKLGEDNEARLARLRTQIFFSGYADQFRVEGTLRDLFGEEDSADWRWLRQQLKLKAGASLREVAEHLLANPDEYRALGRLVYEYRREKWSRELVEQQKALRDQQREIKRRGEAIAAARALAKMSPAHEVHIPAFLIARTELSWESWESVAGFSRAPKARQAGDHRRMPARSIDWLEARRWLEEAGDGLRLPSESEWEYAARAGARTRFPWGDQADAGYATFEREGPTAVDNRSDDCNLFGLVDVIGNVGEWCADDWHPDYKGKTKLAAARSGGLESTRKVVRGGSFSHKVGFLDLSFRESIPENAALPGVGLRVVRGLDLD